MILQAASSRSKYVGFETAEICSDLYSITSGEPSACNTKVFDLFTLVHPLFMNSTVNPFYSSNTKVRANMVYLPLKCWGIRVYKRNDE